MTPPPEEVSVASLVGPWVDSAFESGLIERCRAAWNKPLQDLTNQELATLLRQHIAVGRLLPVAKGRIADGVDDDTENYEGELQAAVEHAASSR